MTSKRNPLILWLALYVIATAGLGWWFVQVRGNWLAQADRPELRAGWEAWKDDVRSNEAAGAGPVRRRVPTAQEPPATILLRDHFPAILVTVLLVWSAFFAFLAMTLTGAMRTSTPTRADQLPVASRE